MKKALALLAALALTLLSALLWRHLNPSPATPPFVETRWLMGTQVTVTIAGLEADAAKAAATRAFAPAEGIDAEMARRGETPLDNLNRSGRAIVSEEMHEVVAKAIKWAKVSDGAFDPTVGALVDLWAVESGPHPPPGAVAVLAAKERTGWRKVKIDSARREIDTGNTILELGGIAKGYALDRAAKTLEGSGASGFIIDAGGDIVLSGDKGRQPWRVGIQDPREGTRIFRILAPKDGSIVTSGDYERYFEWDGVRYSHIVDPATGHPASGVRSATVWAKNAVDADALATAVCVLGAEKGLRLIQANPPAEALIIDDRGVVRESVGFKSIAPEAGSGR